MAYSQFLQRWAHKLNIYIGPGYTDNEMLVCRGALEGLDGWLAVDGHESVLPAVEMLRDELFATKNEIERMYRQGKLLGILQSNNILSIRDLRTNIQEAYSYAVTASEKENEGDHLAASKHILKCHECIQKTLAVIVIHR